MVAMKAAANPAAPNSSTHAWEVFTVDIAVSFDAITTTWINAVMTTPTAAYQSRAGRTRRNSLKYMMPSLGLDATPLRGRREPADEDERHEDQRAQEHVR